MTDRYAVIGNPVAHSQSPRIHAAFARQTGAVLSYERLLAPLDGFAQTVRAFQAVGGRGANVTVPFKEQAFDLAARHSARALAAGAVNTLRFDDGGIYGDNTDGVGLVRDLSINHGVALRNARVLLIGAGGAARGVVGPLLDAQPRELVIANRTLEKAVAIAARFAPHVEACGYGTLAQRRFDVLVNATSASLAGQLPPIPDDVYAHAALAYDMMYGAAPTLFLQHAAQRGTPRCIDGLGMLVEQAAESFLVWRGVRPETAPVLAILRADLQA
jgi:shikimate dehydrogenase